MKPVTLIWYRNSWDQTCSVSQSPRPEHPEELWILYVEVEVVPSTLCTDYLELRVNKKMVMTIVSLFTFIF